MRRRDRNPYLESILLVGAGLFVVLLIVLL